MDVEVEVRRFPACRVDLVVKAHPAMVGLARKEGIKKVNREVTVPGFRRGKAPEELIAKQYGSAVEREWHKTLADMAYKEAQRKARIPVVQTGEPIRFDLKSCNLEKGAELVFSFETEPVVPTVDPQQFEWVKVDPKVEEKQVDEAIHQSRYYFAEWSPVDRGVEEGDTITIDLDTINGQSQQVFRGVRFEVSAERMAEWMKRLVLGAKAGDVLEGMSEGGEMEPKKVRLTLKKVEQAKLPELDDAFAKKMGVENLTTLRESVRTILHKNLDDAEKEKVRETVNQFLLDRYDFEVPLSLIETEQDHRMKHLEHPRISDEEQKKAQEQAYLEASRAVKLFYLARQIVRDAKIPVAHSEVEQEATLIARSMDQKVDPAHLPKELFALALSKVLLIKAQEYVISQGKELDVQETQPL
jgi:trigger factor